MKKMNTIDDFAALFERSSGKVLRRDEPLAAHAFFRIGGPADLYFRTDTPGDLRTLVGLARRTGLRYAVIGAGSNLLFDDEGYRGLVIQNAVSGISRAPDETLIEADSGTPLESAVEFAASRSLAGMEFLAGIPGTVGGAVYGNAGAFGRSAGDILEYALLLGPDGGEFRSNAAALEFAYRHSNLKLRSDVLLRAGFSLAPGDEGEIRKTMSENLNLRARRHPDRGAAYPGSFFKNPVLPDGCRQAAGYLLEQAGARGLRSGAAAVYSGHCNFIINEGGATARDVRALAAELKRRVREKFGIVLEEEVIFLPAAGPAA
ncbi:MAG: UDP-N-acetylmuramate dehydrogenase [Candidatus Aminicenantales bacterium]|jgi:UDP-N-acetylmuramate dehydrogenase